jgi:hypothetical protein
MKNQEKLVDTVEMIRRVLAHYTKPALMCSFGKDSMVLLSILRWEMDVHLPVVFHRDPWWPKKYAFADKIIADWNLEVHDWPPSRMTMWEGKEIMAFTSHYQTGPQPTYCQATKNILIPENGKKWMCGVDVLNRPVGAYQYPFNLVLIGHKSTDSDQIAGDIPLALDVRKTAGNGPDAAFPLRHWTDEDIWEYIEEYHVPMQFDRYDVKNRKEWPDKTTNSDYAHMCIACIDRRNKDVAVHCPKLDMQVENISRFVPYEEPQFNYYGNASR